MTGYPEIDRGGVHRMYHEGRERQPALLLGKIFSALLTEASLVPQCHHGLYACCTPRRDQRRQQRRQGERQHGEC
jgi:hypothetical protein